MEGPGRANEDPEESDRGEAEEESGRPGQDMGQAHHDGVGEYGQKSWKIITTTSVWSLRAISPRRSSREGSVHSSGGRGSGECRQEHVASRCRSRQQVRAEVNVDITATPGEAPLDGIELRVETPRAPGAPTTEWCN